jgi:virulence factor Mce-like protein
VSRRRATASIAASPVLVGAVTLLVAIVAVFLAYNANAGLPFVPTYDLRAELPSGGKLVKGNEVRVGGFRVGVIDKIRPTVQTVDGKQTTIAKVDMKLDKTVEPLGVDTKLRVRPRSALGLKYVEVVPGKSKKALSPGSTVSLKNASEPLEIEDVLSTFDRDTRPSARVATEGFGEAFAGRGPALNATIEQLNPFFAYLTPVMTNLASPETDLPSFFRELGRASAQVAPVAEIQAQLFTNMADTFAAIGFSPRALQDTIAKGPETLDVGTRSLRAQRPFLDDFAELSVALRPAVQELPRSLPALNQSFRVGTKVLPQTVPLNERLQSAFVSLDRLFGNPNTLLALRDIRGGLAVTRPLVEYLNPYQSVCNYPVYFLHALGEHMSAKASASFPGGTVQGQGAKLSNAAQPNGYGQSDAARPADVLPNQKARGAHRGPGGIPEGEPAGRLFGTPYPPAIDAQGNADCQVGQTGYPNGPLYAPGTRYGKGLVPGAPEPTGTGGNGAVAVDDYPVLTGGTYKSRQLGIDNLKDVP